MSTQVSWDKIRNELQRLTDVETLKDEVHRIRTEIRKFDLQSVLSPSAQAKVKHFEKRYAELMRSIHQAQRQMDREFNRILRNIRVHRTDVSKTVNIQKQKLERASEDLRKRFAKVAKATAKTPTRGKAKAKKTKTVSRKRRK